MTEFSLLGENSEWQRDFERRLRASYSAVGLGAAAVEHMLEDVRAGIGDWTVAEIADAGTRVGYVAVVVADDNGTLAGRIGDLCVDTLHTGGGTSEQPGTGPRDGARSAVHAGWTYGSQDPSASCSTPTAFADSSGRGASVRLRNPSMASSHDR